MKNLDYEELIHLALHAIEKSDHHKALEFLNECLETNPGDANVLFLIGAEHAEIGLNARAIREMERALEINPALEVAALQLGLLYSQQGNEEKAIEVWTGLKTTTEDQSLLQFCEGFLLICDRNFDEAKIALRNGIEANHTLPALNLSVENILKSLEASANSSEERTAQNEPSSSVYLGAYTQSNLEES
ncbi:hypothetical protein TDB9533_02900 [Thalassocella blandensis]|nr:hypothetical protein TDB9533_02900 [Thalassocella blandensis]